jgi:hypothetical protein
MERRSRKRSSGAGREKMERVTDREKWRRIVRQAKAHNGLWRQRNKKYKKKKKFKNFGDYTYFHLQGVNTETQCQSKSG